MKTLDGINLWNRSCDLAIQTHRTLNGCRDSGFRDALTRASLALASGVADGYERDSRRQSRRCLQNAKGSCAELRTQLYIAGELGIIDNEQSIDLIAESLKISTMLQAVLDEQRHRPRGEQDGQRAANE
jgi:four helix bundle protein